QRHAENLSGPFPRPVRDASGTGQCRPARVHSRQRIPVGNTSQSPHRPRKEPPMASERIRNPHTDQLLSPESSALIVIDYQPIQVSSLRSMARDELVLNIASVAKAAINSGFPIIHSTVNVATGLNKPPIRELQDVLGHLPTYDRTSINSWEDT